MQIERGITLDLLETNAPALSATTDMPIIETKPDADVKAPEPKLADAHLGDQVAPEKEPAAPDEGKTEGEPESATELEQPEGTSASDEPPKKVAKGVQKRLDELTRQREDERRRADAAQDREVRLLALLEANGKPKEPDANEPVKPRREDFADDTAYTEALVDHAGVKAEWKVRNEFATKQAEEQKARNDASIAEQTRTVQQAYAARVDKFKAAHADYSDVAESPDVQVSIPMAHAIAHAEQGPEIAYFLGKNPAEAKRISSLAPPVQLMELGLIVAKLNATPVKPVSAAPAPIKPIKSGTEAPNIDPENESMEAYATRRKKEMAAQARPGMRH